MNNDRPPACSPSLGEDGKLIFKLQWPYSGHSSSSISSFLVACKTTPIDNHVLTASFIGGLIASESILYMHAGMTPFNFIGVSSAVINMLQNNHNIYHNEND
jgi:hypothetical protein